MNTEFFLRTSGAFLGALTLANVALAQNWTTTSAPGANWISIASSADGTKLVAAEQGSSPDWLGLIYTSTNSGATWTPTGAPSLRWWSVASSDDGNKLVAGVRYGGPDGTYPPAGGPIYISADSGTTWTATTAPITNWSAVASSADGSKLVAV
jgi:hypothetical protein